MNLRILGKGRSTYNDHIGFIVGLEISIHGASINSLFNHAIHLTCPQKSPTESDHFRIALSFDKKRIGAVFLNGQGPLLLLPIFEVSVMQFIPEQLFNAVLRRSFGFANVFTQCNN